MFASDRSPFFERMPVGVYRSSLDGKQLRANPALVRLNGYESEEELLAAVQDIGREWYVLPSRRTEFAQRLARDGQLVDFVSEVYRHKTRERIWVRETAYLVQGEDGQPTCYEGTVQDITAEHEAQLALQISERRSRALAERAQVLTLVADAQGLISYASQAAVSILGCQPSDMQGQVIFDWIHGDDMVHARKEYDDLAQSRNSGEESLFRMRHADGSWRTIAALGLNRLDDPAVQGLVLSYRDVTERERALQAMRYSQQCFEMAFAASPDALIISRLSDGCYLAVNDTFVQWSGFTREELIGHTSVEMNIWADAAARAEFVQIFVTSGEVNHFVAPYKGRGDRRGWVEISARSLVIEGTPCVLAISRDITATRATQEALVASEARLRLALTAANQGWYDLDIRTNQLVVSPEYAQLLGYEPQGFVETEASWYARMHPDDRARVRRLAGTFLKNPVGEYRAEFRQRHRQGRWIWLLSVGKVMDSGSDASPSRLLGTLTDITQRKHAELELRTLAVTLERRVLERTAQLSASESRYRRIFDVLPMAIVETDWSGVLALIPPSVFETPQEASTWLAQRPALVADCLNSVRVIGMNPAARQLYGWGDVEPPPAQLSAILGRFEEADAFSEELAALLAGQRYFSKERVLRLNNGGQRHLQLALALPDRKGGETTALAGLVDVSELKRLAAELDASLSQARKANRELDGFAHSVAHDLKAPLRAVAGYSHMLLEHCKTLPQEDADAHHYVERIRDAAQQMGRLTDDLLAYARMEGEQGGEVAVSLAGLVTETLREAELDLKRLCIVPVVEGPDLQVRLDAKALKLVLRNLVANALKFSANVEFPRLAIRTEPMEAVFRLSVTDNGIGFDMAHHDLIFQIFQRLNRSEAYSGSGVGLAMVAKAVARMGGRIWAQSAPGQGATFFLELPNR